MRRLIRERVADEDIYRVREGECALSAWWYRLKKLDRRYLLRSNGLDGDDSKSLAEMEWNDLPEEQRESLPMAAVVARYALAIPLKDGTI